MTTGHLISGQLTIVQVASSPMTSAQLKIGQ
jgi:hypothetical protein